MMIYVNVLQTPGGHKDVERQRMNLALDQFVYDDRKCFSLTRNASFDETTHNTRLRAVMRGLRFALRGPFHSGRHNYHIPRASERQTLRAGGSHLTPMCRLLARCSSVVKELHSTELLGGLLLCFHSGEIYSSLERSAALSSNLCPVKTVRAGKTM